MKKLTAPKTNWNDPDDVLAQTVGADSDWLEDAAGCIYDQDEAIIAKSLPELGKAMRDLGWFGPSGTRATGVDWKQVPQGVERARAVRAKLL